jgi:hypothetical protein
MLLCVSMFPAMLTHFWRFFWRAVWDTPSLISSNWLAVLVSLVSFAFPLLKRGYSSGWGNVMAGVKKDLIVGTKIVCGVWIVLFLVSIATNIYQDHQYFVISNGQLRKQLQENGRALEPKLGGRIDVSSMPVGKANKDEVLIIEATITNLGSPTVITDWDVNLRFPDGTVQHGQILVRPANRVGNGHFFLSPEDYLTQIARRTPIATGGACSGWLYARFTDMNHIKLMDNRGTVVLTFSDVNGKPWSIELPISRENSLPPPLGIEGLQEHRKRE